VLNFWASWCGPCEREAPALEAVQQRLQRSGGTVVGVTYKDYAEDSRGFVRRFGLTYPTLRDDRLDLAPKYGTNKLPETFVLDGDGRVVAISRGEASERFLMDAVKRAGAV
jgi:cytochrome c biogenesis protein CcmG, thiol:disulfide interchange protein DsbE